MAEPGPLARRYAELIAEPWTQRGDVSGFEELMAEDCRFLTADGVIHGRAAIVKAVQATAKALDWSGHELLDSNEHDGVLIAFIRNTMRGQIYLGGGAVRFRDGRIVELTSVGALPER